MLHSWVLDPHPAELTLSRNITAKISFHLSVILSEEVLTQLPYYLKWRLSQRRKGRMPGVTLGPPLQALRSVGRMQAMGKSCKLFLDTKEKVKQIEL